MELGLVRIGCSSSSDGVPLVLVGKIEIVVKSLGKVEDAGWTHVLEGVLIDPVVELFPDWLLVWGLVGLGDVHIVGMGVDWDHVFSVEVDDHEGGVHHIARGSRWSHKVKTDWLSGVDGSSHSELLTVSMTKA